MMMMMMMIRVMITAVIVQVTLPFFSYFFFYITFFFTASYLYLPAAFYIMYIFLYIFLCPFHCQKCWCHRGFIYLQVHSLTASFHIASTKYFTALLQFPSTAMSMKSSYINTRVVQLWKKQSSYLYNALIYFLFHNIFLSTYLYLQFPFLFLCTLLYNLSSLHSVAITVIYLV